jgi:hypothetical protein
MVQLAHTLYGATGWVSYYVGVRLVESRLEGGE